MTTKTNHAADPTPPNLQKYLDESAPFDGGELSPDVSERASAARARLLNYFPFFGSLACRMTFRASKQVLAAIQPDGTTYLNEDWVRDMPDCELAGLLCHEVMHPAGLWWERKGGRDHRVWNMAHDYVINRMIQEVADRAGAGKKWLGLPPGGLVDSKYDNMSADEIYRELMENAVKIPFVSDCATGNGGGDGEQDGNGSGGMTQDQREYWKRAVVTAAETSRKMGRGDMPGDMQIVIDEILSPKIPWQKKLQHLVGENYSGEDYTYRKPSRRQRASNGIILAATDRQSAPEVILIVDTSGSMYEYNKMALAEIDGICRALRAPVRVIFCDTCVQNDVKDVRQAAELLDQFKGGGGSDFRPAFDHIAHENKRNVLIAVTDGYIGVPSVRPPFQAMIWCVTPNGQDPTGGKYGDVIKLEDRES